MLVLDHHSCGWYDLCGCVSTGEWFSLVSYHSIDCVECLQLFHQSLLFVCVLAVVKGTGVTVLGISSPIIPILMPTGEKGFGTTRFDLLVATGLDHDRDELSSLNTCSAVHRLSWFTNIDGNNKHLVDNR